MLVFVTGASGHVGRAVVGELLRGGHQVLGLARSEDAARGLRQLGAEVQSGSMQDHDKLRAGTRRADAVIHLAFEHDFSNFVQGCEVDRQAINAIGSALIGSRKPFLVPNGMLGLTAPGQVLTEHHDVPPDYRLPRVSEQTALQFATEGVNVSVVRLAQVHDTDTQGLVTFLIALARATCVAAYIGDGGQRWPAVHISDAARLFRLTLEAGSPPARCHAVAEEGVRMRLIAEAIGRALGLPTRSVTADEAQRHFGPMSMFVGADMPASAEETKQLLGWHSTGPTLIDDLDHLTGAAA